MNKIGKITKITGDRITVLVDETSDIGSVYVSGFTSGFVSIGALIGTNLVDGRTLVLAVDEISTQGQGVNIIASVSGIYDSVSENFSFGTNSYPLIGEPVFKLKSEILSRIFQPKEANGPTIGTYAYDSNVAVGYNPNVLFGKHLGAFGNSGSGKTCTVVSVIQRYIRGNSDRNIKFIILDVNGEYETAFRPEEYEYIPFDRLRFHHSKLNYPEYGKLFRAAEGIQYPAMKKCIKDLASLKPKWELCNLSKKLENWIDNEAAKNSKVPGQKDLFTKNSLSGNLRSMLLRIDGITSDADLMRVIDSPNDRETLDEILQSNKKVFILDLQVSSDSLDIVIYLLFKSIYEQKARRDNPTHICLVLEEAHRYINTDSAETKLGNYYIDKLSREGRKFGMGLIISSQVPSMLDSSVVSQCNSVIMHKITNWKDMDFLRKVLRLSGDTRSLQINALEKQYAIVCGEAFPNDTLVRIHDASPLPMSNDPVIPLRTAVKAANGNCPGADPVQKSAGSLKADRAQDGNSNDRSQNLISSEPN